MKYKKISEFEVNARSPFVARIISGDKVVPSAKQRQLFSSSGDLIVVNPNTGEIDGHTALMKYKEVDRDKFVKVFVQELSSFFDLNTAALRVFAYIAHICKPNIDMIYFNMRDCQEFTNYSSRTTITSGLSQLLACEFIAKTREKHWYFINPSIFFNGDRITFMKQFRAKPLIDESKQTKIGDSESGNGEVPEIPEG